MIDREGKRPSGSERAPRGRGPRALEQLLEDGGGRRIGGSEMTRAGFAVAGSTNILWARS